jgi:hypothetical protein
MKIIKSNSRENNRLELIKASHETFGYIVCRNQDDCSDIQSIALKMGYNIPFTLTYDEFIDKKYNEKGIRGFLIEDVDQLLRYKLNLYPTMKLTLLFERDYPVEELTKLYQQHSHSYIICVNPQVRDFYTGEFRKINIKLQTNICTHHKLLTDSTIFHGRYIDSIIIGEAQLLISRLSDVCIHTISLIENKFGTTTEIVLTKEQLKTEEPLIIKFDTRKSNI